MLTRALQTIAIVIGSAVGVAMITGCGNSNSPQTALQPATPEQENVADQLKAKEQELEQREAALKLKEQEQDIARREAELAKEEAAQRAAAKPSTKPAPSKPSRTASPSPKSDGRTNVATAEPARPAMKRLTVPSGTQITVALASDLSTRTAKPGDEFQSRLVSDLIVDGQKAVSAGALVTGTVTDVVSGSKQIGGVPTMGLSFEHLQLDDGRKIAINGELMEQGKSDTGRDTAKILGGAAAGAILGHQVRKDNRGKVIGGLLGGAVGAVAAKKTGTEVELTDGSQLTISIGAPIEITVTR